MNPPTIKDVAKAANVSVATVSRVLHNLSGYSEKTKKKVLDTIEELGYQPNAIARGLVNKRTQTIGVLFPNVSSSFSSKLLHGIEEVAHDQEMKVPVVLVNTYSQKYQIPYVKTDDRQAAYQATDYLIQKGHRNIAMIAGTRTDIIAGIPRVEGYKQALSDNQT